MLGGEKAMSGWELLGGETNKQTTGLENGE